MSLFRYPSSKHSRRLSPPRYKRYRSYKGYLQHEFERTCVYCRQPDSSARNLNFGIDHYRPKSLFPKLAVDYSNLYYCCGNCNSYKNDYWPRAGEVALLNPCQWRMSEHIRFEAATGRMTALTPEGRWLEKLLELNDTAAVKFRRTTLATVNTLRLRLIQLNEEEMKVKDQRAGKPIPGVDYEAVLAEIAAEKSELQEAVARFTGTLGLRPLPHYDRV